MSWTLDYKAVEVVDGERRADGPWTNLDQIECPTPKDAWNYLTMVCRLTGLDYYAAMVRPVR